MREKTIKEEIRQHKKPLEGNFETDAEEKLEKKQKMRSFTKKEAKQHKDSLKEMFEPAEKGLMPVDEHKPIVNRLTGKVMKLKQQRDELLAELKDILKNHYLETNKAIRVKKIINKIEGDD